MNQESKPLWHCPMIVRVIMDGQLRYYTGIFECNTEYPSFGVSFVRKIFGIGIEEEWLRSEIRYWYQALAAVTASISKYGHLYPEMRKDLLYIVVRPAYGEIEVMLFPWEAQDTQLTKTA